MARGRMISRSLSTSEKRAALHQVAPELAEFCQQLYPLLIAHADDFGRLQGDAFTVKHAIDPTSPRSLADFELALEALQAVGLILRYLTEGRRVIQIVQFESHQTGLHKRTRSVFPEQPADSGKFPEIPSEEKRTEQKRTVRTSERTTSGGAEGVQGEIAAPPLGRSRAQSPPSEAVAGARTPDGASPLTERHPTADGADEPGVTEAPASGVHTRPRRPPRSGLLRGPDPTCYRDAPSSLGVPQRTHEGFLELRTARGMPYADAVAELDAFYERWINAYTEGGERASWNVEPDRFAFWRARHAETWPPPKTNGSTPPSQRSAAERAAEDRRMRRLLQRPSTSEPPA